MPLSARARRLAIPLVAFALGLCVLGGALLLTFAPSSRPAAAAIGGPFRLVTHEGRPASERDFLGAPHLVFFGFTHCPDVCPTKLFEISEVLRASGERGKSLRALFITVDPERDTPEALKSYLGSFDPRIVGLSGDRPAIDAVVRAYRAFARKVPTKDGDYTMEHTSLVYLMGKDGRFVGSFNLDKPPAEAAEALLRAS